MIVKLRRASKRYPDLSLRLPCVVVVIESDDYRILNDAGRPYLYPRSLFRVVDAHEPEGWRALRLSKQGAVSGAAPRGICHSERSQPTGCPKFAVTRRVSPLNSTLAFRRRVAASYGQPVGCGRSE